MKCCDLTKECEKRAPEGKCETRRSAWAACAEDVIARQAAKIRELEPVVDEPKPAPEVETPAIVPPPAEEEGPADEVEPQDSSDGAADA